MGWGSLGLCEVCMLNLQSEETDPKLLPTRQGVATVVFSRGRPTRVVLHTMGFLASLIHCMHDCEVFLRHLILQLYRKDGTE